MNVSKLGSAGIVLLGLWLLVRSLLGGVWSFSNLAEPMGVWTAAQTSIGVFLLFGVAPAAILIAARKPLSRRWFGRDEDDGATLDADGLLRIGLVLLGFSLAIDGGLEVVSFGSSTVVVFVVSLLTAPDESLSTMTAVSGSRLITGTVQLLAGVWLVVRAERLAERWSAS